MSKRQKKRGESEILAESCNKESIKKNEQETKRNKREGKYYQQTWFDAVRIRVSVSYELWWKRTNKILICCEYTLPTRYNYNKERAGVQAIPMPFKKGNGPDLATVMALKLNLTWHGSANLKSLLTTITMNKDVRTF